MFDLHASLSQGTAPPPPQRVKMNFTPTDTAGGSPVYGVVTSSLQVVPHIVATGKSGGLRHQLISRLLGELRCAYTAAVTRSLLHTRVMRGCQDKVVIGIQENHARQLDF